MYYVKLYFLTLLVFLGIDFIWLTVIAKNFYAKHLGYLMSQKPNLWAALVFYLIYISGILILVTIPSLQKQNVTSAILMGALYGLVTYATYDLTNLATIKDWPIIVTIIDLLWGITLSVVVATASYYIGRLLA